MSRMAAKFGGGTPTAGGGVGGSSGGPSGSDSHHQQGHKGKGKEAAKKFCTRGEEFFEFLKGLGYQPPKHQQFEHLEYLFQDDVSTSFVRKFMSTLKTQHCVLPDELERYETLQKQKLVVYGSDLEEAVTRRRTVNEMYSQQKFKRLAKRQELEKELKLREGELSRLRELEAAFSRQVLDWEAKHKQSSYMADVIQNLIREDEKEIEIDLKLLNMKQEELEASVLQLKKDLSVHRPQRNSASYICQIDGKRLLEAEERLFETIREMIRKHGTSLIMKDAGYGIEGDLLSVENIKKVFAQFEKDFNRVKHSIIYEKVTQLSSEISLAGQQAINDNFEDYCMQTTQLSEFEPEIRTKLQKDTLDSFNNANIALQKEKEELLNHARQVTLVAVNRIFSGLTNIKTRSKKKLQEFFTVTTNALKGQKVRIPLIRNLVKAEAQLYGRLLSNINENLAVSSRHTKKLLKTETIEVSDLTLYGQILQSLLIHFGVHKPLEVVASVPNILTFVRKTSSEFGKLYWSTMNQKQSEFQDRSKHLRKTHEVQAQMQKASNDIDNNEDSQLQIRNAEEYIKEREMELKTQQQSRATLSQELQKQREANTQKCRDILQMYQDHQEK